MNFIDDLMAKLEAQAAQEETQGEELDVTNPEHTAAITQAVANHVEDLVRSHAFMGIPPAVLIAAGRFCDTYLRMYGSAEANDCWRPIIDDVQNVLAERNFFRPSSEGEG